MNMMPLAAQAGSARIVQKSIARPGIFGQVDVDVARSVRVKYLGLAAPRNPDTRSIRNTRVEALSLYRDLLHGARQSEVAHGVHCATAFAIAATLHNMQIHEIFSSQDPDIETMILEMDNKDPEAHHPMSSRFWFMEALRQNGFIPLGSFDRRAKPTPSIPSAREVFTVMEDFTDITAEEIRSANRGRLQVHARFQTIFVLRRVCLLSLARIGNTVGGRDHTTILNSLHQAELRMRQDAGIRRSVMDVCDLVDTLGVHRHIDFLRQQPRR